MRSRETGRNQAWYYFGKGSCYSLDRCGLLLLLLLNLWHLPMRLDNYSVLMSYFLRQSLVESSEIRRYLGVDDEYEDIC